ncbi:DUF6247 family protein [Amycolatopsis sp. lyj-23]|uniref:DUF6247 family protein n=1 Tax=Amycolatopsis sp. lyj-23 TaxID=2789283 RepID=UPI00397CE113
MASPAVPADSGAPRPPAADPVAIRRCLPPALREAFDIEWDTVLDQAKADKTLDGIRELLAKWRGIAAAEQRSPGSHSRLLAKASHILATGQHPGARSVEDLRDLIEERLGR